MMTTSFKKIFSVRYTQWNMLAVGELDNLRQDSHQFEASLNYIYIASKTWSPKNFSFGVQFQIPWVGLKAYHLSNVIIPKEYS